jgi:aminoglycoside/choline kinase family phosphotransferase
MSSLLSLPIKHNIVVHRPKELSTAWAQRIVSHHASEAKVSALKIESVSVGTSTRYRISVEHDAVEKLPTRWFVKTPSLRVKSRLITSLPRLLPKEVHFYRSLSQSTPLKLPPILAAQTRLGRGTTLVMADLGELGFIPGQALDALSAHQATQVIEQLARFHGHYWQNNQLLSKHHWLGGFGQAAEHYMGDVMALPLMKRGLKLAAAWIPGSLIKPALHYAANRRQMMHVLARAPQTLVHHDCHPGNLFWHGSQPGFLDWQLVRIGEGISDVAYFLATSLHAECRRQHEQVLLSHYLTALSQHVSQGLDEKHVYRRYRAHLAYAFEAMVITLAVGGMMETESNIELIRRTASAVEDHDSFAVLNSK